MLIVTLKPLNTYMDLNIGTAFWFAARGSGYLREYSTSEIDAFFGVTDNDVPLLRVTRTDDNVPMSLDKSACVDEIECFVGTIDAAGDGLDKG